MKNLFDQVCQQCSQHITKKYSTSFSSGIRAFHKGFREPIYSIYGFVRFADEIVDTFHDHDKRSLLDKFEEDTFDAIDQGISLNPVLHAFQLVVNNYGIEKEHIRAFLESMRMDLSFTRFSQKEYERYIYGSAEVVGLMCLKVFLRDEEQSYYKLEPHARALGSAFQKINFLRDFKSDFEDRGRIYFPGLDAKDFDNFTKKEIEEDISADFEMGYNGIQNLPKSVKFGVYLAYIYYTSLFAKIKSNNVEAIMTRRIRVKNRKKLYLVASSAIRSRLNLF